MARTRATIGFFVFPVPTQRSNRATKVRDGLEKWSCNENPQFDSPLYNKLSAEIRIMIFELVLYIHNDCFFFGTLPSSNNPHPQNRRQIYRPTAHKRGYRRENLALLQTCQVIYREAQCLPVAINTHVLLYPPIRALSFPVPTQAKKYLSRMKTAQIEQIRHLHLFVGSDRFMTCYNPDQEVGGYRSETPFAELGLIRNGHVGFPYRPIRPSKMTITVRHNEWNRRSVGFVCGSLSSRFLRNQRWDNVFEGLQCLIMELEIQSEWSHQLYQTVEEFMAFEFDVGAGKRLVSTQKMDERTWKRLFQESDDDVYRLQRDEERLYRLEQGEEQIDQHEQDEEQTTRVSGPVDVTVFTIVWRLVDDHS